MKKNVMMRVASALLVAVLMTTCAISGTFAKYTSEATGKDTARVARWGWGETTVTLELFAGEYDGSVASSNGDNLIAPGTSKTASIVWSAQNTFKPEVDYTISFNATATIPEDVETELDWTLQVNGGEVNTYATFGALQAAIAGVTYAGQANTAAPTIDVVIGWVWEYSNGGDAADTALGEKGTLDTLTVNVTLTATQDN